MPPARRSSLLLARERYEELGLWRGQTVWFRPRSDHVFTAA